MQTGHGVRRTEAFSHSSPQRTIDQCRSAGTAGREHPSRVQRPSGPDSKHPRSTNYLTFATAPGSSRRRRGFPAQPRKLVADSPVALLRHMAAENAEGKREVRVSLLPCPQFEAARRHASRTDPGGRCSTSKATRRSACPQSAAHVPGSFQASAVGDAGTNSPCCVLRGSTGFASIETFNTGWDGGVSLSSRCSIFIRSFDSVSGTGSRRVVR